MYSALSLLGILMYPSSANLLIIINAAVVSLLHFLQFNNLEYDISTKSGFNKLFKDAIVCSSYLLLDAKILATSLLVQNSLNVNGIVWLAIIYALIVSSHTNTLSALITAHIST